MAQVAPQRAAVKPRAIRAGYSEAELLEDLVAELLDEGVCGEVPLVGGPGSGRTTALAHLAAVFEGNIRLVLADEPSDPQTSPSGSERLHIVAATTAKPPAESIRLSSWRLDELVEYLLAFHPQQCGAVLQRLGPAANWTWSPQLAAILLDRFAADAEAIDPIRELVAHISESLLNRQLLRGVRRFCFGLLQQGPSVLDNEYLQRVYASCSPHVRGLLRHRLVQLPLAADGVVVSLQADDFHDIHQPLSRELIDAIAERCIVQPAIAEKLQHAIEGVRQPRAHPMAASIVLSVDPAWKLPANRTTIWNLHGARLNGANWPAVRLTSADLRGTDFTRANLEGALLIEANATEACFHHALLDRAYLNSLTAPRANFSSAALRQADLSLAKLWHCDLTASDLSGANLTDAHLNHANLTGAVLERCNLASASLTGAKLENVIFRGANLTKARLASVDLRTADLQDASLEFANLTSAQLEDIRLPKARLRGANLEGAHLTGSYMPLADLRGARLVGCGLAEIDWEGANLQDANLRGATFHMGSSRSGLVGSPIACEGSKTGFYTDDYEDMHFKRPEEIRKANLCGADLRGSDITNLDFYLVDLRSAQLDPAQLVHVRRCGAILGDVLA